MSNESTIRHEDVEGAANGARRLLDLSSLDNDVANSFRRRINAILTETGTIDTGDTVSLWKFHTNILQIAGEIRQLTRKIQGWRLARQAKSREAAGAFLIGDRVWYDGNPHIVLKSNAGKREGRLLLGRYDGHTQYCSTLQAEKLDPKNEEEVHQWETRVQVWVDIGDRVRSWFANEASMEQWVLSLIESGGPCASEFNAFTENLVRGGTGVTREQARGALIRVTVKRILESAEKEQKKILGYIDKMALPSSGPQGSGPQERLDLSVYAMCREALAEAYSLVFSQLKNQ